MAERIFRLPGIQELNKEQERARALPKEGQYLVVGGPGTGKSVLALLRARRHAKAGDPHVFLVYNRLLHEASCCLGGQEICCFQWMTWFFKTFEKITTRKIPRLAPVAGSSWREIDWEKVHQILLETPDTTLPKSDFLIIDEGQDMPPDFYQALVNMGYMNFFVAADQNQQIVSGKNSSRRDIEVYLDIDTREVVELKQNFRNTEAIARLVQNFYTGDAAVPRVEPAPECGQQPQDTPLMFTFRHDQFYRVIRRILLMADRTPSTLIGIITPNNQVRQIYVDTLKTVSHQIRLDNGQPYLRTFFKGSENKMNFHQGGIMVINAQSCKGLEFDRVFLADINRHPSLLGEDKTHLKRLFYVMTARARQSLILLRREGMNSAANAILPTDTDILKYYP
ncbi:3'-5' exonuclease [uncultured Desulfobacter sp.]|uniref:3'-5' exonuclease n=1 Tax=uncultured Desulfobacter sp. TaxID=240139 RepID=UPI002AAC057C|nr:3'-5' exonuclease [uncultured Desulfobacter sp.]